MLVGTLILFFCTLTLMYWFRYTCQLILRTRGQKDYSEVVAEANGLSFLENRRRLQSETRDALDTIQRSLHRDYELVCCLLRHSSGGRENRTFQQILLRVDYLILRTLYCFARLGSGRLARYALLEMANVVGYLAHSMGERAALLTRA